jgi:hypothetical protein
MSNLLGARWSERWRPYARLALLGAGVLILGLGFIALL